MNIETPTSVQSTSEALSELDAQLQRISASLVQADPTDLPALADLHSDLLKVADLPGGSADTARRGAEIVEQIILRETNDANAALRAVVDVVAQLQAIADGGPMPVLATVATTGPAHTDHSASAADEPTLGESDLPLVHEFISEAAGHIEAAEAELLKLEKNPDDAEAVNAVFRSFHTIKGVAGFMNLKQIGALAHASESLLDLARNGKLRLSGPYADIVLQAADQMRGLIRSLDEAVRGNTPIPRSPELPDLIQRLKAAANGQLAAPATAAVVTTERRQSNDRRHTDASESSVKVSTARLDSLINTVGELVIAESMVRQNLGLVIAGDHRLQRNLGQLGKLTRELQDLSMAMRMVPIGGVFQKMTRLVRDVSQKADKEVELVIVGAETELDRNVVDAIGDPLVHMVRNSIDHGIEKPDDRERAGKPRAGRVELKAEHKAGGIVIQITDDGKGLNKARILKKATEAGIVREGQDIAEQDIFRLIFHAGLSTAEKVTDISGRGVGMDVVKRNIEDLRGRIEISSVEGKGTVFTIRLPLTLAVIDGLLVRVGTEKYILPITSVEQSLRPTATQISTVHDRGELCMVRGNCMPLLRLGRLFNTQHTHQNPTDALVVIVRDNDRQCCLLIDELLGQQQVVIKSLGDGVGNVRGVSGGAILGDGNVCLILDVPGIIDLASTL